MIRLIDALFTGTLFCNALLVCSFSFADEITLPTIPDGAQGVLFITDIRMGRLMALKGMKGEGRYLTRNERGELCEVAPVSFRAGSINSYGTTNQAVEEVTIEVYSRALSERLTTRQKIVSEDYRTALQPSHDTDLVLSKGISLEDVFILNPRPIWRSWINTGESRYSCKPML